jgi:nicotinamide-nucleotide amidase
LNQTIADSAGAVVDSSAACVFKICGLNGTELAQRLVPLVLVEGTRLSVLDNFPDLTLRLELPAPDKESLERLRDQVRALVGSYIYAEADRTLEEIVGALLLKKKHTLALAESCTGGYISHRITRISGSSVYYYGGVVSYSNDAKVLFLGVKRETLERHGAVSRETALEMAKGIRERTGATIGLSVTGVAGPGGGSTEKPVGTVWISTDSPIDHEARRFAFDGERERIISAASQAALDWLRRCLL